MSQRLTPEQRVWLAAGVFTLVGWTLQWWRLHSFAATMDQGILFQVLWNGLSGHPFESTLSSQLSTNVVHGGQLPAIGYHRLGQHFTPTLALWIPLVALLGKWALPMLQVALIAAAGLVLHRIARLRLEADLAAMLTLAFFGANAVIGPTLGNFTDLSQLPLCVFVLLLGLLERRLWLTLPAAFLMPLIREDTGVVLVGIGLWLLVRQRSRWPLALALIAWGGGWVVLVTNVLMPLFSQDNSRRFMVENFGQYLQGQEQASSLETAVRALQQPLVLLRELVSPPRDTLLYLAGQGLPLLFIPWIALDSWLLMGLPLLGLLLAQGSNNPLSINIRYTYLVVPGLFAGSALWWQRHQPLFASRRLRRVWAGCILLSLLFTLGSNPNRSLSWLIPDSIQPLVYSNPMHQWQHSQQAHAVLGLIPSEASVAASTPLIPHLAARQVLVRFPDHVAYQTRAGQATPVDWIAVDLDQQQRYAVAFPQEQKALKRSLRLLKTLPGDGYQVQEVRDGVVLLQRNGPVQPAAEKQFNQLLAEAKQR
ncbi:DUF2079 domain-containing protein [Synechococcus sp. CBW1107]|uniref:DUF2079 domain-containing protein n=1 Tax=Synechococcus sp. CBW1107 TaxID=2789857 RepID=UPI002AD3AD47|nr:DUF2079 domain-containing protein [Synechococcus sp. CBW1107]CAK6699505.1 hypothetical protein MNNICLKF_02671 [Synechococcus sp. CBW1107]